MLLGTILCILGIYDRNELNSFVAGMNPENTPNYADVPKALLFNLLVIYRTPVALSATFTQ